MTQSTHFKGRLYTSILGVVATGCLVWWARWRAGRLYLLIDRGEEPRAIYSWREAVNQALALQGILLVAALLVLGATVWWWRSVSRQNGMRAEVVRWVLNMTSYVVLLGTILDLRERSLYTPDAWVGVGAIALLAFVDNLRRTTVAKT